MKSYKGEKAIVTFDETVCTHAGRCVKGLPSVFNLEKDPWIDPNGADVEDLKAVIAKCPSGALTMTTENLD